MIFFPSKMIVNVYIPSKHKICVYHFYNVVPTSLILVQQCMNVIQMFVFTVICTIGYTAVNFYLKIQHGVHKLEQANYTAVCYVPLIRVAHKHFGCNGGETVMHFLTFSNMQYIYKLQNQQNQ